MNLPRTPAPDPRLARPLPSLIAFVAILALMAATLWLLRYWYGSWAGTTEAMVTPAIGAMVVTWLWWFEGRRGRPLSRGLTVALLATTGVAAGCVAGLVAPLIRPAAARSLGGRALIGLVWGVILALGWIRSSRRGA